MEKKYRLINLIKKLLQINLNNSKFLTVFLSSSNILRNPFLYRATYCAISSMMYLLYMLITSE